MTSFDLTDEQREKLFGIVSRTLDDQHELIAWLQRAAIPPADPLYRSARASVMAMRELYLILNDDRRKGRSHQAQKRAKYWPKV